MNVIGLLLLFSHDYNVSTAIFWYNRPQAQITSKCKPKCIFLWELLTICSAVHVYLNIFCVCFAFVPCLRIFRPLFLRLLSLVYRLLSPRLSFECLLLSTDDVSALSSVTQVVLPCNSRCVEIHFWCTIINVIKIAGFNLPTLYFENITTLSREQDFSSVCSSISNLQFSYHYVANSWRGLHSM